MTVFSPHRYDNSRPGHRSVLEIPGHSIQFSRFAPLKETQVGGEIAGSLASLCITQLFDCSFLPPGESVEAVYRFPLPGDALIKGVTVRFGETMVKTSLAERKTAESQYRKAKKSGQQAVLLTQEAEDVFTLHLSGITSAEGVQVETEFLLWLSPAEGGFSLRIPLTAAPRFSRGDEKGSKPFEGQPYDIQWDPGHRARLSLRCVGFRSVECPSNALMVVRADEGSLFISFEEGSVFPDQDILLTFITESTSPSLPGLQVFSGADGTFLALATPPEVLAEEVLPREIILLVDHSGSMDGAKKEAADWAVGSFLSQLGEGDSFNLGFFHSACRWMSARPVQASKEALSLAANFIENSKDSGGTELGMALEQALRQPGTEGSFSRHVLVITDGQATDFARINTLLEREGKMPAGRRVSVVSIDSAPNEPLTRMMAEKGRGLCSFLSSNPDEVDITTSLDEIFKDFSRPFATGVSLSSSCSLRDAEGIITTAKGSLDLGELISGRSRWICGRCEGRPDGFSLLDGKGDVLAAALPGETSSRIADAVRSLWGALRIRKIETLMESKSFLTQEEIARSLADLGISFQKAPPSLYGQSDLFKLPLEKILLEESLKTGVLCSETAFAAVREEKGIPVSRTFLISNALPRGWNADPGVVFSSARFTGFNPLQIDETITRAFEADSDTMSAVLDSPKYCRMPSSLKHQLPSAFSSSGAEKIEIFRGPLPPYKEKGTVLFSCTGGEGVLKDAAMLVGLRAETMKKSSSTAGKGKVRVLVNGKVVVSVPLQKLLAMGKTRPLNILLKKGNLLSIDIMDSTVDEKCLVKMTLFCS